MASSQHPDNLCFFHSFAPNSCESFYPGMGGREGDGKSEQLNPPKTDVRNLKSKCFPVYPTLIQSRLGSKGRFWREISQNLWLEEESHVNLPRMETDVEPDFANFGVG